MKSNFLFLIVALIVFYLWQKNKKIAPTTESTSIPTASLKTNQNIISDIPTSFNASIGLNGLTLSWYTPDELTYKLAHGYTLGELIVPNPNYDPSDPNSPAMINLLQPVLDISSIQKPGYAPLGAE